MSLVLGLEHSCPWPRECLSSKGLSLTLASDFFVSLPLASSLVSSTTPLILILSNGSENVQNFFQAWLKWLFLLTHHNELTKSTLRLGVRPRRLQIPIFDICSSLILLNTLSAGYTAETKKKRLCKPSLSKAK